MKMALEFVYLARRTGVAVPKMFTNINKIIDIYQQTLSSPTLIIFFAVCQPLEREALAKIVEIES